MLKAYICGGKKLQPVDVHAGAADTGSVIWFDLISPTDEEYALAARLSGLELPTESDIVEIENSSRVAVDEDVLTMTMPIVFRSENNLRASSCGFVLAPTRLVTIRFAASQVFEAFPNQPHETGKDEAAHSAFIFVGLLEAIVDRQADALEQLRNDLDALSHRVFRRKNVDASAKREPNEEVVLRKMLTSLGLAYDTISILRESQHGIDRIAPFVMGAAPWLPDPVTVRLKTLHADVHSLNDFSTHLTDTVQFLLDATLGLISIAQNTLMKVFTIVSVVGIPPTLVAGIYGMNFHNMPELNWTYGYAYGWAVIILSAVLPLALFRYKRWI